MSDGDARRTAKAARRIGLWVGGASATVILAGVGILIGVIVSTSRPERDGRPVDDGINPDHVVVDVDRVMPWVIVLGMLGVLILAGVAWIAARRAVAPLGDALRLQRNFVSDASHELRTPLTALDSRIQILQRRLSRGEPIDETIRRLQRDAAVMDETLTDLLLAAESDAATSAATRAASDVATALADAAELMRALADSAGVRVETTVDGAPAAAMPAVTLARLVVALGDNAVQHAPPSSVVQLSARDTVDGVEIRVRDEGSGIRPEDRELVFERFARGAESGHRRGFGLGLSLVRDVATRYGGALTIESSSPSGTVFLLRLPVA